jgi:hypothetical protein
MQFPIVIEPISENRFRARCSASVPMIMEGDSAEESLRLWREKYAEVLPADAEVIQVKAAADDLPPWAKFIGDLKDDPLVDIWRECVEEYRQERDFEAGVE